MSPLNCNFLPTIVEPISHTIMGRSCQIVCCIEIFEGAHFSHNLLFCFRPIASALNSTSKIWIPHSPAPTGHSIPCLAPPITHWTNSSQENMPNLRHRMWCRRGSSRNKETCHPSLSLPNSIPSDSSTPLIEDHFTYRYPATCSGRGNAQTTGSRRATDTYQPPNASVLMMESCAEY